jgi:X-X-X-Leu-X-X-Gly heptad repeat protein
MTLNSFESRRLLMTRASLALIAVLLVLLAPLAMAQPNPDAQGLANQTAQKGKSLSEKIADGLGSAAKGVGQAADGVGQATGAIGHLFAAVAQAVADGTVAAASTVARLAGALSDALAMGAILAGDVLVQAFGALGSAGATGLVFAGDAGLAAARALGSAAVATGQALGSASAWVGTQLAFAAAAYANLVGSLRLKAIPEPAFTAAISAGASAAAVTSGWGLLGLLRRLGWLGAGVAGFSRIEDDELLKHPLRTQIFQVIQGNPGIHASELGRRMGTGWGTIIHHLDKLEKGRIVAVRKVNNQKCYFESGGKVSRQDMAVAGAVRGDSAHKITTFVQSHPMTSQKALSSELGISPALTSFHVKKLVNLGVLDKVRQGKHTLLTTTDALRRIVAGESAAVAPPLLAMATLNA